MNPSTQVEAFRQAYLATLPEPERARRAAEPYTVDGFGNTPEDADEYGLLVQAGVKTTTSGLLWDYEAAGDALPRVGDVEIIVDGRGIPLCVTEVTEVEVRPFDAIDESFAFEYGEGERTLAWWQQALWEYYEEECARLGREPLPSMPLVCIRFRLLYAGTSAQA